MQMSRAGGDPTQIISNVLSSVDFVPTTVPLGDGRAQLLLIEDNEAVVKMTIKGRSPNMRHITRTHRVDLDWLFERLRTDLGILMKYVNTKKQVADILTKGSVSRLPLTKAFSTGQWSIEILDQLHSWAPSKAASKS